MQKSVLFENIKERYVQFIEKGIQLERFFLVFAILFGIGYMIINTPNSVYDERIHYVSAYHYSDVLLFQGFSMEDGSYEMRSEDAELLLYSDYNGTETVRQVADDFHVFQQSDETVELTYGLAGNFWQYIPQTIGITIGRLLHLGAIPTYYLGRVLNLALYIMLVIFALRLMPFGKTVMTLAALLPICIQQAASYNYDSSLFGLGFLFLAFLFDLIYTDRKITQKYTLFFGIVTWLFAAQKMGIYVVLCVLLFFIPKDKFKNTKFWFGYILLIGGIYVLSVLLNDLGFYFFFPKDGTESMNGAEPVVTYAIRDVLGDPVGFLKIVANSIAEKWEYYIFSLFGNYLASYWLQIPDSYGVQLIILLIIGVFAAGNTKERESIKSIKMGHRIWFLILFVVQWLVYWVFFFVNVTPVGEDVIWGVQGRYFVPVIVPLFLIGLSDKIHFKRNHDRAICTLYACVLMIIFSLAVLTMIQEGDAVRRMIEVMKMG